MKKILSLVCVLAMAFSLVACGGTKEEVKETEAPVEKTEAPVEETEAPVEKTEAPVEETKAPEVEAGTADISSAIEAVDATEENLAPLGTWVKTARYATQDKTYHTVYVRVTKVTTQTEDSAYVENAIALHNENASDYKKIDLAEVKLPADVELCMLEYEVYVPADFPAPEYGLVEPSMSFGAGNVGGGGIPSADGTSVYIGMGSSVEDLDLVKDPKYFPDNTYTFASLFTMVKGYEGYFLDFTSYPDGTVESSADIMQYVSFDHK